MPKRTTKKRDIPLCKHRADATVIVHCNKLDDVQYLKGTIGFDMCLCEANLGPRMVCVSSCKPSLSNDEIRRYMQEFQPDVLPPYCKYYTPPSRGGSSRGNDLVLV